ncbi:MULTISPECIES: hypothetical protein [unclassified Minwuia]|jgi:uncharacterized phage-associated protein|uniref:hypothetical protein n=1 Tax=unclassified Minwuia TaxID=2618799 RepID=UPI00247AD9E8|nr:MULTISPECIES: hypothetical protein [unclassified Minwuia]
MSDALEQFRTPALKNSLLAVAWFEAKGTEAGRRIPPRKMQMLLYIAQALYAAVNGCRLLMPSVFVASTMGPQDPNLYDILENAKDLPMPKELEPRAEACLTLVWRRFGGMGVDELDNFIAHDGVMEEALQTATGAILPLPALADAYRRSMIEPAQAEQASRARTGQVIENTPISAPIPEPIPEQEGLPDNVPRMTMGGKPVRRWAPKRRVY